MTLVRAWLLGTALIVLVLAVWAFAPVLVFIAGLTLALGLVSAFMVMLARGLRGWLERSGRRSGDQATARDPD